MSLDSGPSLASLKLDESSMPESSPGSKTVPGSIKAGLASLRSKDKDKGQATTPRKIGSPDSFSRYCIKFTFDFKPTMKGAASLDNQSGCQADVLECWIVYMRYLFRV